MSILQGGKGTREGRRLRPLGGEGQTSYRTYWGRLSGRRGISEDGQWPQRIRLRSVITSELVMELSIIQPAFPA